VGQPEDEDALHDDDVKDIQATLDHLDTPAGTDASTNPFTSSQNYIGQSDSTSRQDQSKDGREGKPTD